MASANYCKHKKQNLVIAIVVFLGLGVWFAYDGYLNKDFIERHTSEEGIADDTLNFNRNAPYGMAVLAIAAAARFAVVKDRKLTADEKGLDFFGKERIEYSDVESVNKTWFDSKGYFIVTYKDRDGKEQEKKISKGQYDGLKDVLDTLVSKIS